MRSIMAVRIRSVQEVFAKIGNGRLLRVKQSPVGDESIAFLSYDVEGRRCDLVTVDEANKVDAVGKG